VARRTVGLDGIELAVAESGVGGRPLLLLHGFCGAKEDFTEWLPALAERGWHAVAPDHRGHGESSKPDGEDAYSLASIADDTWSLVGRLGWDRFALLGHSMGGYVARLMVDRRPERITALVLMDTGHGPVETLDRETVDAAVDLVRSGGTRAIAEATAGEDAPLDTPAGRRLLAERPGYAEFCERKLLATSPGAYAALARELIEVPDRLDDLRRLSPRMPVLIVVGEQDAAFLGSCERMAAALPWASLAVVPDAGHSPQFENPRGWWGALSAFLDEVASEATGGLNPPTA
jgi:pimeloyl-ACP methyl ester carboxylesterase